MARERSRTIEIRMANEVRFNRTGIVILCSIGLIVVVFLLYSARVGYTDEKIRISELLSACIDLAERGGRRVIEVRKMSPNEMEQSSKGQTKEGAAEYVTLGDRDSHQIITSGLMSRWPHLPFRSEEKEMEFLEVIPPRTFNAEVMGMANRNEEVAMNSVTVWIDPLDATQEYTEGKDKPELLQFVTVMLCIAVNGKPIAGVVHQPFASGRPVTKWSWIDHGVSRSLYDAANSKPNKGKDSLRVTASRSHAGNVFSVAGEAFKGWKTVEQKIAAGSGFKSLAVAEKNADLYLHTTAIKKWDICAGNAILNALHGRMTTLQGAEIDYSFVGDPKNSEGIVAAYTGSDHAEFLNRLMKVHH